MKYFTSIIYGYLPTGGMNNDIMDFRALLRAPEKMVLQHHGLFQCYSPSSSSGFPNLRSVYQFCLFPAHGFLYQSYCPIHDILLPTPQACPFLTYISWLSLLAFCCSPTLLLPLPVQVSFSRHSQSHSHSLVSLP